jgi:hypothetical protein
MTLVSGVCRIIQCAQLFRGHTVEIHVGCPNKVTIHGDVSDAVLQGTCNCSDHMRLLLSPGR